MRRRGLVLGTAAMLLAAPRIGAGQGNRVLTFVPAADLVSLDPHRNTTLATRIHALLVFDTLYGVDMAWKPQPQMLEGHVVEDGNRSWTLTLREGLRFHDGTPVLARDVAASLRRWARCDAFGGALLDVMDEIAPLSDRRLRLRLNRPFPLLPDALGKAAPSLAVIMPERLAMTDPGVDCTEVIGSGPYRYLPEERVPGQRVAYARNLGYIPRPSGMPSLMAGPKIAHFDRVEWRIIPDAAHAAASLAAGEIDWWEQPAADFWPILRGNPALRLEIADTAGQCGLMRLNLDAAPCDDVELRRAALGAISQSDAMAAITGTDGSMWRTPCGLFLPGTPMASEAGLQALRDPPNRARAARMLQDSSYRGEKLILLAAADQPGLAAQGRVVADAWSRIGLDVEYRVLPPDPGGLSPARLGTIEEGWHALSDAIPGVAALTPATCSSLAFPARPGQQGPGGLAALDRLRQSWLGTSDTAMQKEICRQMQTLALETVPSIPTGVFFQPTAYRASLLDVPRGFPQFHGVRKV
ncbi:ABC transporter substrate-binding protein [Rhodovastum atsumiense]|nr:ABC transporter substrate-binding protein [Rhodovastum atsumiense]